LGARGASLQITLANYYVTNRTITSIPIQKNFYDRYEAYKYCCAIGMNMTMENDVARRLEVMKFMNTDRPANGARNHSKKLCIINIITKSAPTYGFIFADTYTEIESGTTVDYFCETDVKFNNAGDNINLYKVTSCISHRSDGLPIASVSIGYTQANAGDSASTYFVCDP
jgi:hypothetical protein